MENNEKTSGKSEDTRNDVVIITITGKQYKIHRGNHKVSEIKELGGINPNHILVQIVRGQLIDLPNDGSVTIKGSEEFKSHPPVGDNS